MPSQFHSASDSSEARLAPDSLEEDGFPRTALSRLALDAAIELECFLRGEECDLSVAHALFKELKEETSHFSTDPGATFAQRLTPLEMNALCATYLSVVDGKAPTISEVIQGTKSVLNDLEEGLASQDSVKIAEIIQYCNRLYRNIVQWQSQLVDVGIEEDRLPIG